MSDQVTEVLRVPWTVNLATPAADFRMLQHLARLGDGQGADWCGVSDRTWRRWRAHGCPSQSVARLLSIQAGYVPWGGWTGWEVHQGLLFPPGLSRHGLAPGDIVHLPYWRLLAQRGLSETPKGRTPSRRVGARPLGLSVFTNKGDGN